MLRRSREAQAAFILASFEVEVIYPGVRIGVSSVETDALQGRGNETEVALIGYFHTQQISIAGVARLAEFSIGGSVVAIVAQCLVYNEVINLLVEDAVKAASPDRSSFKCPTSRMETNGRR